MILLWLCRFLGLDSNWQKTPVKGNPEWNPTWLNHNTEKIKIFLKDSFHFNLAAHIKQYIFQTNLHIIQPRTGKAKRFVCQVHICFHLGIRISLVSLRYKLKIFDRWKVSVWVIQDSATLNKLEKQFQNVCLLFPLYLSSVYGKRTENLQNIKTVNCGSNPSKLVLLAVATFLFNNGWAQTWLKFLNQVLPVYSSILCTWYSSMTLFKYILNQCRSNEFLIVGLVCNIILRIY